MITFLCLLRFKGRSSSKYSLEEYSAISFSFPYYDRDGQTN